MLQPRCLIHVQPYHRRWYGFSQLDASEAEACSEFEIRGLVFPSRDGERLLGEIESLDKRYSVVDHEVPPFGPIPNYWHKDSCGMFNASPVDSAIIRVPDLSNTDSYYGQRITYLATASDTRGSFLLLDATERQGVELPPHVHENEDETIVLLEGEATFFVGDQIFEAGPGDLVFMPRGVPHHHRLKTESICALLLVTPGAMEGYYRALIRQAEGKTGVPDVNKVRMIGVPYGIEFVEQGRSSRPTNGSTTLKPVHTRAGEGEILDILGIKTQVMLTGQDTGKSFSAFVTHDLPNYGPPMHVHHNEHESFVVLEGEYVVQSGDVRHTVKAGAFLHMPKETPHTYARISEGDGKLLVITMPSGFEKFFRALDALPPLPDGTPDFAGLQKVSEKHGLDIIGPPISFS